MDDEEKKKTGALDKETFVERDKDEGEEKDLKPWEQHSAVISIPRFDYKAPSSLLHNSHSGFLITCPIKREKSATKEAIAILEKYIPVNATAKRRKIYEDDINGECRNNLQCESDANKKKDSKPETCVENDAILSLVKLTRSGLLLFTFSRDNHAAVVEIVSTVFQSLESGNLEPPRWCNRVFPIQATCILVEEKLCAVVSKLVSEFEHVKGKELGQAIKFAVGYNRRGIEEAEVKGRTTSNDSDAFSLLDRNKCFSVVAAAVKDVLPESVVDLKCPQFAVLIELLPLSGVPDGSPVVAVSVLPRPLVNVKPKLCIKPLVADTKAKIHKVNNSPVVNESHLSK